MKKIIAYLFIIIAIFSLKINVFAENEGETTGGNTGESGTETTGENEKEEDQNKEDNEDESGIKSDATIKNVALNDVIKIVCNEKNICEKTITDSDIKSVKVTYELTNKNSTIEPNEYASGFTKELKTGENEFKITVTSEDKSKSNTYTFKIIKKTLSTDSSLKSLIVNGTSIELKEGQTKYTTTVSYATKKLEIEAIPNGEASSIADFKNNKASFDFFENSKEIKIKVLSEAGDMTTYTLTVNKRSEADVTLKSLTIKNYKIDFSSDVNDYGLKVLKNIDKLEIEAKANDSKANVKITNPKLTIGENTIKIDVSNDGNTNTYIIKVTKLDEDDTTLANLKSLSIKDYNLDFKPNKYEYDLRIDNDVNYLKIDADPKMDDADVEITGNLDLEDGSIIKIKVIYDEDIYNVYTINIIKDGKVILKNKVSKKFCIAVIIFDILAIIGIGVFQFIEKNKNNKKNNDQNTKQYVMKKKNKKENNILESLEDEIDII